MEEIKNTSVSREQDQRKPYEPPTAEIILLAPKEELAGWSFSYNGHDLDDRWALNGWGYSALGDPASGTYGTVTPNAWTMPED